MSGEHTKKTYFRTLIRLFIVFLKAGTFTLGGGLPMLAAIQKDLVERKKLMPEEDFLEYATLSQTLPGVMAVNFAVFVGKKIAGVPGMLIASFGASFPAFVLMIAATELLEIIPKQGPVVGALAGVRAASAALILSAAFSLGRHNLKSAFAVIVMLAAFALVVLNLISAVIVILAAGLIGCVYQLVIGRRKKKGGAK